MVTRIYGSHIERYIPTTNVDQNYPTRNKSETIRNIDSHSKKKNGNRNTHTLVPYAARIIKIKETKNKIK